MQFREPDLCNVSYGMTFLWCIEINRLSYAAVYISMNVPHSVLILSCLHASPIRQLSRCLNELTHNFSLQMIIRQLVSFNDVCKKREILSIEQKWKERERREEGVGEGDCNEYN